MNFLAGEPPGEVSLECMDCVQAMRAMPAESVDLVVTSPPYDNLRTYNGFEFDFEAAARALARVLKPGGVIVWVVGDATINGSETGTSYRHALFFKDSCGLRLHDTMIYEKAGVAFPDACRYYQAFEFMFIFSKGAPKTFAPIEDRPNSCAGDKIRGSERNRDGSMKRKTGEAAGRVTKAVGRRRNIWRFSAGWMKSSCDREAFGHPAIFPEALAADHIRSWSRPGDVVFDPFMGSGTTGKMAIMLGRRFAGVEVSREYFVLSCGRLERALTLRAKKRADAMTTPE